MKNFGSKFEYKQERDDDLMNKYTHLLHSSKVVRMPELLSKLVNMPSKRFWVSGSRAAVVISNMKRGDTLATMNKTKREMFYEIYRRAMDVLEKHPDMLLADVAEMVVQEEAPKFYLTENSAKVIICKIKRAWFRKRREQMMRRP